MMIMLMTIMKTDLFRLLAVQVFERLMPESVRTKCRSVSVAVVM